MALAFAELKRLLTYDPVSGVFRWNKGGRGRRDDLVAGTSHKAGYVQVNIDHKRYYAHRLAWLWMTGEWPPFEIDHRNLDKADTRWVNLRKATHSENLCNTSIRSDSKTGAKGVHFEPRTGRYTARVSVSGKITHLGTFATVQAAAAKYRAASNALHGKFGRST